MSSCCNPTHTPTLDATRVQPQPAWPAALDEASSASLDPEAFERFQLRDGPIACNQAAMRLILTRMAGLSAAWHHALPAEPAD